MTHHRLILWDFDGCECSEQLMSLGEYGCECGEQLRNQKIIAFSAGEELP